MPHEGERPPLAHLCSPSPSEPTSLPCLRRCTLLAHFEEQATPALCARRCDVCAPPADLPPWAAKPPGEGVRGRAGASRGPRGRENKNRPDASGAAPPAGVPQGGPVRAPKRKRAGGAGGQAVPERAAAPAAAPAVPRAQGQQAQLPRMFGFCGASSRPVQGPPAPAAAAVWSARDGVCGRVGGGSGTGADDCINIVSDSGSPEPPTWA
jgi:hypothetical protein